MRTLVAVGLAFGAAFALSLPAHTDVLILDDGMVVECKIKDIKYPDQKNLRRFVLIVAVDEKGTTRQYKSEDIKAEAGGFNGRAVYRMKTRWEKRADYLKEYTESKLEFVKETWESQQTIGKWCKSRLLPEKGVEHYRKALALRLAQTKAWLAEGKLKDELEQHLKIAKWCQKELGLFDEAKKLLLASYEMKKKSAGDASNADVRFSIGRWCETVDLDDEAMAEYQAAVAINPKHSSATSAIARIQNSVEFKFRQLVAEYDGNGRAWRLTVAIEDQADKKFMDTWAAKIQELSQYVWDITEGQFFIGDCEIEDQTSDGRIIIEKGKMGWSGTGNAQGQGVLAFCIRAGEPDWEVHCAGKNGISVIAHEIFHGIFGLPDEYYQDPQCDCVMRSAPNPQKLCAEGTHVGSENRFGPRGSEGNKDCWRIIMARPEFKGTVRQPNTAWEWIKPGGGQKGGGRDADGTRNSGGILTYRGLKTKEPPKTVIRIVDN